MKSMFMERIAAGLKRKAVTKCSKWAETYRVMGNQFPGPWGWGQHPWLYEIHDRDAESLIVQKAAQIGFTELALNKSLYTMDVLGLNVLYILPTDKDASDFSAARFDKALEMSPYLSSFFVNVKNVGHKRAGSKSLDVRGSRSKSQLKSVDTAFIVYDEYDEMKQSNIALAKERQSGQVESTQREFKLSTPTIDDYGINEEFKEGTQEHYFFKCPCCGRLIELLFPDSIKIIGDNKLDPQFAETHYICTLCNGKLHHQDKPKFLKPRGLGGSAHFVPSHTDRAKQSFYVNQMYSTTVSPVKFATGYLEGIHDPTKQTEFFNSKVAIPHRVAGSKIEDADLIQCISDYSKGTKGSGFHPITMGVDVGSVLHFEIDEWYIDDLSVATEELSENATPKLLYENTSSGKMTDFDELDDLMRQYNVAFCVIDAEPERREALKFANRWWSKVYLCDFIVSQMGRTITYTPEEECTIRVNRTSWIDVALARFRKKKILLPSDVSETYKRQIKVPQRVYKFDNYGNPTGVYESTSADHFAFSRVYAEIALQFAITCRQTQDIYD